MEKSIPLNLSKLPVELKLIIELAKCDYPEQAAVIDPYLFKVVNWDLFIKQTRHHRIYPFLYKRLQWCDPSEIPEYVLRTVEADYKRNIFLMLRLSGEMQQLSCQFMNQGIPLLFLKGPVLAAELYGDVSLRTSNDLDVLVQIEQLPLAEKLLTKLGYQKDDYIQTILNDWKWRHHHITYTHPVTKVKVEVHWRLNPGPAKEPGFEELWARKRMSSVTRQPIYMLGEKDLFLFLISHGARHGWSRLRWLLDVHQLLEKHTQWARKMEFLGKYGYRHVGLQAIELSTELFDSTLPLEVKRSRHSQRLAQQAVYYLETMVNLHSEPLPKDIAVYHKRHLFSLMTAQQKICFILSFLYPYPQDAETLPLPKFLHFLYFPLRPFLWGWRKSRKLA
ncbi:nucleotidyltransferase family protein [Halobacillus sp. A1]|uniref:nucleotidyltransferase domain-containing protein n=1 Tax=Halobacillus sp. A1 TaxID=2880262 RepID=UPI0020A61F67|nr:nucleotidyltransferase family protein [Halobacillus sp. A1]MCP3030072.1 nucleotidyltransferase family protein [Halobacillus sp. A1]